MIPCLKSIKLAKFIKFVNLNDLLKVSKQIEKFLIYMEFNIDKKMINKN